jgi:hypothetical protein
MMAMTTSNSIRVKACLRFSRDMVLISCSERISMDEHLGNGAMN